MEEIIYVCSNCSRPGKVIKVKILSQQIIYTDYEKCSQCGVKMEEKPKKEKSRLSRDELIRVAALNAAVPAWVHHHNMTCHADFKSKGLFEIVKDMEAYIREGKKTE